MAKENKATEPVDNRSLTAKIKDLELDNKVTKKMLSKQHDELEAMRLDIALLHSKIGE
jgi:hypothetical protein